MTQETKGPATGGNRGRAETKNNLPAHDTQHSSQIQALSEAALSEAAREEVDIDAEVSRLAALHSAKYDQARGNEAKRIGIRVSVLDQLVRKARQEATKANDSGLPDTAIHPDPVNPAELLDEIVRTIRRFIICPAETTHAAALWITMSHLIDDVQVAPLAVIASPEKRCGKTQLLSLIGRLARRPLPASNITPAALFRSIEAWTPTLLIDEADSFLKDNEELRGILNSGHTRETAFVIRVVGDDHQPRRFSTWGAKAIAGIGRLADTLEDRAVILKMRRKLPHDKTDRLRHANHRLFPILAGKIARFAEDYRQQVKCARPPEIPELNDRAADNWEPLLAIAMQAGGAWLSRARTAAILLSGEESALTIGAELLADIHDAFDRRKADKLTTADLIHELCEDEEAPWSGFYKGKPITPRQLASRLREYGISSKDIRPGYGEVKKGYEREQFAEAWQRYLSTSPPENCRDTLQAAPDKGFLVADKESTSATTLHPVADNPLRSGNETPSATAKSAPAVACRGIDDNAGVERKRIRI